MAGARHLKGDTLVDIPVFGGMYEVRQPPAAEGRGGFGRLVGRSPAMREVFAVLEKAAASEATILLGGETGTGKEASAEAIHVASKRRQGPFVVVDCSAIPPSLIESELFGHERGAFTGAVTARAGALESANGGTVFLDEIGELDMTLQPKLLRVLERREVKRVGSNEYRPLDVRLIAATHKDLRREIAGGRFRSDLYFRLAVVRVALPPLRARGADLPELVERFLDQLGASGSAAASCREPRFLEELARYEWPGNIRELRNHIERCLALGEALPPERVTFDAEDDGGDDALIAMPLRQAREGCVQALERRYVTAMLRRHGANVSAAARAAGVDRIHFYRLLWKLGIQTREPRGPDAELAGTPPDED